MAIFHGTILGDIIGIVITFTVIIIAYYQWAFQYWKKRNLPYLEPSIPFGNLENPSGKTISIGDKMAEFYKRIRARGLKHCGIFMFAIPAYFVTDLDYIKNIMAKDFQHFVDRGFYINEKIDPIGAHLFAIGGVKWRNLRTKLTPTFTSGKMKNMFQTVTTCGINMAKVMEDKVTENNPIDIKEVLACFTTDIIGSCAFGLDCNTFKEPDSPFRKYGKKIFDQSRLRSMGMSIANAFPRLGIALGIRQMPKDVGDFFTKVVRDTVKFREENNVVRKDFLQLLIDIKNQKVSENNIPGDGTTLSMSEVVAQSFVFFLAGFETSSTTMTFALYELAANPDIQYKVREEINTVLAKHDGQITYDSINEMKYMGQVIDESLRKYPPLPFVTRQCTQDYKVQDDNGVVVIEKDIKVIIPIMGIHYDEEYYPNPTVFDPDRFSEENKKNRHPYAHIPFGEGPRICIGMRFGVMQAKVGLATLLKDYKFSLNKKTQVPLKMSTKSFILTTEGGIWLNFEKI